MIIVMLGAPGVGKGTMSSSLSEYYEIPHISTGDILREIAKEDGKEAEMIKTYLDKGELVPEEIINKFLVKRIEEKDAKNGYILDGYPRTMSQVKFLESYLKENGKTIDAIVNIETPKEEIIDRIVNRVVCPKCHAIYNLKYNKPIVEGHCDICDTKLIKRSDDTKEKVEDRLLEYETKTHDIVEYYHKKGELFKVLICEVANKKAKDALKAIIWYIENKNKN